MTPDHGPTSNSRIVFHRELSSLRISDTSKLDFVFLPGDDALEATKAYQGNEHSMWPSQSYYDQCYELKYEHPGESIDALHKKLGTHGDHMLDSLTKMTKKTVKREMAAGVWLVIPSGRVGTPKELGANAAACMLIGIDESRANKKITIFWVHRRAYTDAKYKCLGRKLVAVEQWRCHSYARRNGVSVDISTTAEAACRSYDACNLYTSAGFTPTPTWGEFDVVRELPSAYKEHVRQNGSTASVVFQWSVVAADVAADGGKTLTECINSAFAKSKASWELNCCDDENLNKRGSKLRNVEVMQRLEKIFATTDIAKTDIGYLPSLLQNIDYDELLQPSARRRGRANVVNTIEMRQPRRKRKLPVPVPTAAALKKEPPQNSDSATTCLAARGQASQSPDDEVLFTYPPGETTKDRVTLTRAELMRLRFERNGGYLNDSLIDYQLKRFEDEINTQGRCHFFGSLLNTLLLRRKSAGYFARSKQPVNLFDKDFLFVPIHCARLQHWSLAVICCPSCAENACIVYVDSLNQEPSDFTHLSDFFASEIAKTEGGAMGTSALPSIDDDDDEYTILAHTLGEPASSSLNSDATSLTIRWRPHKSQGMTKDDTRVANCIAEQAKDVRNQDVLHAIANAQVEEFFERNLTHGLYADHAAAHHLTLSVQYKGFVKGRHVLEGTIAKKFKQGDTTADAVRGATSSGDVRNNTKPGLQIHHNRSNTLPVVVCTVTRQHNTYDCGLYMLEFIRRIAKNQSAFKKAICANKKEKMISWQSLPEGLQFTSTDINDFRNSLIKDIERRGREQQPAAT